MIDDEILEIISARIEVAVKERFESTKRQIESIQKCVDGLSSDLDIDRKNLSNMAIDTAAVLQQGKELLKNIQDMVKRITNIIKDQTHEVLEETAQKVADQVEPVMNEAVKKLNRGMPLKKFHWWQRLK